MGGKPDSIPGEKRPPAEPIADSDTPDTKKRKRYEEKPQRANRRTERRQLMTDAKATWEKLRPKATTKDKSSKLVNDLLELLNNRIVEFVFRHDGSRIVQWILSEGTAAQKKSVMLELMTHQNPVVDSEMPFFVRLACDRYGHHLAFKMLRVSDKSNRKTIFERYLRGNAARLIRNAHGADVLDFAYQTVLNARQRSELVIELLYSRERKLLDTVRGRLFGDAATTDPHSVTKSTFAKSLALVDDAFKDVVVESAAATLAQLLDKETLLRFEVLHAALKEYMIVALESYAKEKSIEMAVQLAPLLVHLAHTKAGVFVAVTCIKVLDAKHRKKAVRGLKTHIRKILEDEYGHRLIVGLCEWVDDTRLVGKTISTEILSSSSIDAELGEIDDSHKTKRGGKSKAEKKGQGKGKGKGGKLEKGGVNEEEGMDVGYVKHICMHKYGRTLFLNLFFGRDTRYLNPDVYGHVWEEMDEEKFGKTSKKDGEVRRRELRAMFENALGKVMKGEMRELLQSHWSAGVVVGAAQCEETREAVMVGMTACLQNDEWLGEVVGSKCGRKTIGTIVKVGEKGMARRILEECGLGLIEKLVGLEEGGGVAERLVERSGWNEAERELERMGR